MLYLTSDQFPVCAFLSILCCSFHVLTFVLSSPCGIQSYRLGSLGELKSCCFLVSRCPASYPSLDDPSPSPGIKTFRDSGHVACKGELARFPQYWVAFPSSFAPLAIARNRPSYDLDGRADPFRHPGTMTDFDAWNFISPSFASAALWRPVVGQSQRTHLEVDEGRRPRLAGGFEQRREHVGCPDPATVFGLAPTCPCLVVWYATTGSPVFIERAAAAFAHKVLFALSHRTRVTTRPALSVRCSEYLPSRTTPLTPRLRTTLRVRPGVVI